VTIFRITAFMVFVVVIAATALSADPVDRVWIEPPTLKGSNEPFSPRKIIERTGTVQRFDDSGMVFFVEGETTTVQVSAARVIWVEPGFNDTETIAALKQFRDEDYAASISPLLASVSRGTEVWRAQWLSMHLWQAAFQAQRYPAVLELVNQIDARPLPPMILGGLPVQWLGERLPTAAIEAAQKTLADDDSLSATKLVAASWLLGQANDAQAVAVLQSLSFQKERPVLALLATTLLWRKALPPDVRVNHRRWRNQLSNMPLTLIPGPTTLVADRLEAAGAADESLELFLSVGMTPTRPDPVVKIAKERSELLLEQRGQQGESQRFKQE